MYEYFVSFSMRDENDKFGLACSVIGTDEKINGDNFKQLVKHLEEEHNVHKVVILNFILLRSANNKLKNGEKND